MGSVGIFVLEVVLKIMAYSAFTGKKAFFKVSQAVRPAHHQPTPHHQHPSLAVEEKALT